MLGCHNLLLLLIHCSLILVPALHSLERLLHPLHLLIPSLDRSLVLHRLRLERLLLLEREPLLLGNGSDVSLCLLSHASLARLLLSFQALLRRLLLLRLRLPLRLVRLEMLVLERVDSLLLIVHLLTALLLRLVIGSLLCTQLREEPLHLLLRRHNSRLCFDDVLLLRHHSLLGRAQARGSLRLALLLRRLLARKVRLERRERGSGVGNLSTEILLERENLFRLRLLKVENLLLCRHLGVEELGVHRGCALEAGRLELVVLLLNFGTDGQLLLLNLCALLVLNRARALLLELDALHLLAILPAELLLLLQEGREALLLSPHRIVELLRQQLELHPFALHLENRLHHRHVLILRTGHQLARFHLQL
mmetsp:Transcript_23033/g.75078  ORF Transcript_23033/g.75078 Transcript_23033/m.75078 type:complete len:365 (+) Transcript_23033:4008-5102(+)